MPSSVGILVVWKLNAKIDRGYVVACSAATVSGNVELRDYLQENACKRLEPVAARDYFKQVGYMIRKAGQNKYSL